MSTRTLLHVLGILGYND